MADSSVGKARWFLSTFLSVMFIDSIALAGGDGNDSVNGGSGYDIANFFLKSTECDVTFSSNGAVQVRGRYGSEGIDQLNGIERITFTNGGFYNIYTGDAAANNLIADVNVWSLLYCGEGNDSLTGGNGNDLLNGGLGSDSANGGAGDDVINGYGNTVTNDRQFDSLVGGGGSDLFAILCLFSSSPAISDRLTAARCRAALGLG